ncbi:ferritin-like domain-containing protein [Nocardioides sp. zg-1308]|uniref:ferritin-like domain-containing protein n=1 Tax=Nocardioides sp. zg-1308 TaxID=2736253 RepID=UPI0015520BAE|nr:ferritin-like domain-containing protein [Nocardioides sp. zg-1308]
MPRRPLTRRTTVGSALCAPLVLAGCDIDPPVRDGGTSAAPAPPPDAELVAAVVGSLVRAQSVLEAATSSAPALGARLAAIGEAHAAHLDLLAGAVPGSGLPSAAPPTVPSRVDRALGAVRRSEQRLLREAREACAVAASGDLARVLASIAASTAQHSAALAGAPTGATPVEASP